MTKREPWVTEAVGDEAPHVLVRRFRLTVVTGPDAGSTFVSTGASAVIGTQEAVDLVLTDRTVSRFHCEIVLDEQGTFVRDLGSRNGVTVDGVPVLYAPLRPGAVLGVGRTEVRFELGTDHARVPVSSGDCFGDLVGASAVMRAAFARLERAAASDATVLLEGETGTGKEAAAESVHARSRRAQGPFVVVDCGSIPADLLESELFGHEKGAFTGAVAAREGAFEAAAGGTVFLDEIGELALDLQPKLLRVIEAREIRRVGSSDVRPVDVRIVAATNRNLRAAVNQGDFRTDLYYRLAVVEIRLPPLRERREDIPMLVGHLLERLGATGTAEAAELGTPKFLASLERHDWPGNVRELRNYLERCLVLRARTPLEASAAPGDPGRIDPSRPYREARQQWLHSFERAYLDALLRAHDGNVAAAARTAGLDRAYLYRLLWRHGLR